MTQYLRFGMRFYLPIVFCIGLVSLSFVNSSVLVEVSKVLADVGVQVGIIHFQLPAQALANHDILFRVAILLSAFTCMIWILSVDFSKFIPNRLSVKANFSIEDIENIINKYFSEEQKKGTFASSWKELISTYDVATWNRLRNYWESHNAKGVPGYSKESRENIYAYGEMKCYVKKIGLLRYKMVKCEGHLDYTLEIPGQNQKPFPFTEKFRLTNTYDIETSLRNLLSWPPTVILKPEFYQNFSISFGHESSHDHKIVAMTRFTLLPFPLLSSTLYLWKLEDENRFIPIGYGNYYELSSDLD